MSSVIARSRPPYRWAVLLYDRLYRLLHGLDHPTSEIGPVLRVEIARRRRALTLPDGTRLRPGDRVGFIHLNNDRIAALHVDGLSPLAVGLEFRRQLRSSLMALAALTARGPLGDVRAFAAQTIFHEGLARLGFAPEPDGLAWPRLVAGYQRALLACLHPAGASHVHRSTYRRARRLWISRAALLAHYGDDLVRPAAEA